ncbi:MAG: isochorismatase family protein [Candidatus Colwellbacteria bacterium]|nr:isochorismatase family protein [Candidatus Colwellbacteria bacterium]
MRVSNVMDYARVFGQKGITVDVEGLCGRIIRGKTPNDFLTLTDDPSRKIVMLVDSTGLQKMVGKTGYEMLLEVGYEPDYLKHKVEEGNSFKLVVFPEGGAAQLATWDNAIDMIKEAYPDQADKIERQRHALKNTSFDEIQRRAGFKFLDIEKSGKNDPLFMTYERFKQSSGTLIDVRLFLYFSVHLRELYSGDGWTYMGSGQRGVKEYIILNKPITELGESEMIDIIVDIPSALPIKKGGIHVSSRLKVHLVIIDPQNDFCDKEIPGFFKPTLAVTGGYAAMSKVAGLIDRVGKRLEDIHVTLDSHRLVDVGHPALWMDQNGKEPGWFTIISADDIAAGIWTPRVPGLRPKLLKYARELEAKKKYQITIWPPHCIIGTWGHNVHPEVNDALQRWSGKELAMVDYVTKGSNPYTEHYGALMAEVPDPTDPGTSLNTDFLKVLSEADIILLTGLASSHCVKETGDQIVNNIGTEHIKKIHILTDCTAPVAAVPGGPDYPAIAQQWLIDMQKKGVTLTTSDQFMF